MGLGTIDEGTRERRYRPAPTRRRSYTDGEKAAALEVLRSNGGNVTRTAEELGIAFATLHDWQRLQAAEETRLDAVEVLRPYVREELADKFEDQAHRILDSIDPGTIDRAGLSQRMMAAGIAVDKMRLLREQSTSNVQEVLSDEEKRARVIAILAAEGLLTEQTQQALGTGVEQQQEQQADECTESDEQEQDPAALCSAPVLPLAAQSSGPLQQEHLSPATYYTGRLPDAR